MTIQRLDHLVLAVQAVTDATAAWRATLDLPSTTPHQPAGTHLLLADLALADDVPDPAFLELVADIGWRELALSDAKALERLPRSRRVARFLADRGEGMFSISLQVDDLGATVAALRARGLPISDPEPGVIPGTRVARIPRANAHGVAIQLIKRPSDP